VEPRRYSAHVHRYHKIYSTAYRHLNSAKLAKNSYQLKIYTKKQKIKYKTEYISIHIYILVGTYDNVHVSVHTY
jgi:hypothetical protein